MIMHISWKQSKFFILVLPFNIYEPIKSKHFPGNFKVNMPTFY